MPEAVVNVPPLQMPSENSSETDNSSTAAEASGRSTDGHDFLQVEANREKPNARTQNKTKMRKSHGKRFQKKSQLRPLNCEKKVAGILKLKSQIPRSLALTPSSSTSSLTTNNGSLPSVLKSVDKTNIEDKPCLVRQKSALILAFRQRKSFSQMDFNHARRQINFAIPSPHASIQTKGNCDNNKALVPCNSNENMTAVHPKDSFVHRMYNQDYYFALPGRDPQMAGMRIFSTIMLNAWRKRRDEVRHLMDEVADLKRAATKTKNQLHVFNSLFRVEQKRNEELNFQLKRSLDNVNHTKSSCESLTTSLISLKADKALLEQQVQVKEQEFESINTLLQQTKSELFKSMTVQRELQASLSAEQRKIQTLEIQKNELINEICELNTEALQKEEDLLKKIEEKSDQFANLKKKFYAAEEKIKSLYQSTEQQLSQSKAREERMKLEMESLENELKTMHKNMEETVGHRLKKCWNNSVAYQKITLQMLHFLAYYALPAMPPPKIKTLPFEFSLNKALSIVKR